VGLNPTEVQSFTASTGTGSLDASRGGVYVVSNANGVALTGDLGIMGTAWYSSAMAAAEATSSGWSGGTFNSSGWSGSGWSSSGWSSRGWGRSRGAGAGWA